MCASIGANTAPLMPEKAMESNSSLERRERFLGLLQIFSALFRHQHFHVCRVNMGAHNPSALILSWPLKPLVEIGAQFHFALVND